MIGRDFARGFMVRLERQSPVGIGVSVMALAMLILLLSHYPFGVSDFHNGEKYVGYMNALNWSLGLTFFTPFFVYFLLKTLWSVNTTITRLDRNRMLVDENYAFQDDTADRLRQVWNEKLRRLGPIALAIFVVAFLAVMRSWFQESGGPLLFGHDIDMAEWDWSVAAMGSPRSSQVWGNALFSLMAYQLQFVFVAAVLMTVLVAAAIALLLRSLGPGGDGILMIPSPTSKDKRRGFQAFSPLLESLLMAVLFAYGHLYLGRVWNIFQRSDYASFQDFIMADLQAGFGSGFAGIIGLSGSLIGERQVLSVEGMLILIVTLLLGVVALILVTYTLRSAAGEASLDFLDFVDSRPAGETYAGLPIEDVARRARDITLWPMKFPGPNTLLLLALFAIIVMFFYRIGFFYLGAITLYVLTQANKLGKDRIPERAEEERAGVPAGR